jgi:hypothetical protein
MIRTQVAGEQCRTYNRIQAGLRAAQTAREARMKGNAMNLTRLAALCALILAFAAPLRAQQAAPATTTPDPEKVKAIRTLIDLTGVVKGIEPMLERMIEQQKMANPQIPAEFWTRFRAKLKLNDLVERMIPVYDRYFTADEVNQFVAFYQSPLGKKINTVMPQLMAEGGRIGEQWGREKAQEVAAEMKLEEKTHPAAPRKKGSATPAKKGSSWAKP